MSIGCCFSDYVTNCDTQIPVIASRNLASGANYLQDIRQYLHTGTLPTKLTLRPAPCAQLSKPSTPKHAVPV